MSGGVMTYLLCILIGAVLWDAVLEAISTHNCREYKIKLVSGKLVAEEE
jgi:hypothetical protein